jgi:hypothetical protein
MGVISVLDCLFCRGLGSEAETAIFRDTKHDDLLIMLTDFLNAHRHYLGYCRIEISQGLNDRGVDVILKTPQCKVGFQVKSHFDVTDNNFASSVKRQFSRRFHMAWITTTS